MGITARRFMCGGVIRGKRLVDVDVLGNLLLMLNKI